MDFFRQEYWSGVAVLSPQTLLPSPPPGNPNKDIFYHKDGQIKTICWLFGKIYAEGSCFIFSPQRSLIYSNKFFNKYYNLQGANETLFSTLTLPMTSQGLQRKNPSRTLVRVYNDLHSDGLAPAYACIVKGLE